MSPFQSEANGKILGGNPVMLVCLYKNGKWLRIMIAKYVITVDDIVAFHHYHCAHSAAVKRNKYIAMFSSAVVMFGLLCFVPPPEDVSRSLIFMGMIPIVVAVCIVYNFWMFPKLINRQLRRMLNEGGNKGTIGDQEIEVNESGIARRSEVSETRFSWDGVERIAETDTHAFIYVSSTMAFVLPKRSFTVGDPVAVVERIRQLMQNEHCLHRNIDR